ncbi:hypothetical protein PUN28_001464 [Cardiocondyla obscurior]|uniref:Uncharacterized protein n=1 Tax=Cardiocondyla obscurior TaxID=286306 RepID=A0AAW2H5T2_9HYME
MRTRVNSRSYAITRAGCLGTCRRTFTAGKENRSVAISVIILELHSVGANSFSAIRVKRGKQTKKKRKRRKNNAGSSEATRCIRGRKSRCTHACMRHTPTIKRKKKRGKKKKTKRKKTEKVRETERETCARQREGERAGR